MENFLLPNMKELLEMNESKEPFRALLHDFSCRNLNLKIRYLILQ